jgi:hypothetical protein
VYNRAGVVSLMTDKRGNSLAQVIQKVPGAHRVSFTLRTESFLPGIERAGS